MGLFDWFGRKQIGNRFDEEPSPPMPWDGLLSIYSHIKSHCRPDQPGLSDGGDELPDEDRRWAPSTIRWASGALDGVSTHHMVPRADDKMAEKAAAFIARYCGEPTAMNKAALYQYLLETLNDQFVSVIDPIFERLAKDSSLNNQRFYELGRWLATEAPDRTPVKLGLAILGLFRQPDDLEVFQALGRHDEFTLFAAVALQNSSDEPELALWDLARNVRGWGRIHVWNV